MINIHRSIRLFDRIYVQFEGMNFSDKVHDNFVGDSYIVHAYFHDCNNNYYYYGQSYVQCTVHVSHI